MNKLVFSLTSVPYKERRRRDPPDRGEVPDALLRLQDTPVPDTHVGQATAKLQKPWRRGKLRLTAPLLPSGRKGTRDATKQGRSAAIGPSDAPWSAAPWAARALP